MQHASRHQRHRQILLPALTRGKDPVEPQPPHGPHYRRYMSVGADLRQIDLLGDGRQHLAPQRQAQRLDRSIGEHGKVCHRAVLNPSLLAKGVPQQVGTIDLVTDLLGDRGDMDREVG